jgi:hypothetical protein
LNLAQSMARHLEAPKPPSYRQQDLLREELKTTRATDDSFLAALAAAGYGGISVDEVIELHSHGVTPAFLRALGQAGLNKVSTKDLMNWPTAACGLI